MRYDLVSVQEAAAILGVHRMTVYRMVDDGRLTVVAKVGASIALERADVLELAAWERHRQERSA
jgi:excisionase family DNA binding protein